HQNSIFEDRHLMIHQVQMCSKMERLSVRETAQRCVWRRRDEREYCPLIIKFDVSDGWRIENYGKSSTASHQSGRSKVKRQIDGRRMDLRHVQLNLIVIKTRPIGDRHIELQRLMCQASKRRNHPRGTNKNGSHIVRRRPGLQHLICRLRVEIDVVK